jgi:hypothetical protein
MTSGNKQSEQRIESMPDSFVDAGFFCRCRILLSMPDSFVDAGFFAKPFKLC